MSRITRSPHLIALSALALALGCASSGSMSESSPTDTTRAPEETGAPASPERGFMTLAPVYFETDRAHLRPEARETLASYAQEILDHPEWGVITIEGHCDERGSDEYNLALGKRRAQRVREFLRDSGVQASRLTTRSFGEESPAVRGDGEQAWRYNRRSQLRPEALHAAGN